VGPQIESRKRAFGYQLFEKCDSREDRRAGCTAEKSGMDEEYTCKDAEIDLAAVRKHCWYGDPSAAVASAQIVSRFPEPDSG
jgi:hypothetical protein